MPQLVGSADFQQPTICKESRVSPGGPTLGYSNQRVFPGTYQFICPRVLPVHRGRIYPLDSALTAFALYCTRSCLYWGWLVYFGSSRLL